MSTPNAERAVTIESGGLRLEGALREGTSDVAAVMLHPHPQYGGEMNNHVVIAVCAALADGGATTLRFNFRGAGGSEGTYDAGRGEAQDAGAAVDFLRAARPEARILLAGYSFGAMIAANVAADIAPSAVVLISPPSGATALPAIDEAVPALFITGEHDQIAPADAIRGLASAHHLVAVAPGVDHGWWPGIELLTGAVRAFAAKVM